MTITVGSLFSGYEGIHLGLTAAGIEHRTLWTADNDKAATAVLTHRLPHVPNLGDVTAVDWRTITTPDLLTGGFPCTDVSIRRTTARHHPQHPLRPVERHGTGHPPPTPTLGTHRKRERSPPCPSR